MGCESINISATTEDIAKQMTPLNSVHQIGLSTSLGDVLIVVWGLSSAHQNKGNSGNRVWIHRYLHNQRSHREIDSTIRFTALNRSIYVLPRRSDCSFGLIIGGIKKSAIPGMGCESIDISTTSIAVAKQTAAFDPPCQIGLIIRSHASLTVVLALSTANQKIGKFRERGANSSISPQPVQLSQNRWRHLIRRAKSV